MVFDHDFKYCIPEMDSLLGVASDIGIHFTNYKETTNDHGKDGIFVVQIASMKKGKVTVMFSVTKTNPKTRGSVQPPSGRKLLINTSKGGNENGIRH